MFYVFFLCDFLLLVLLLHVKVVKMYFISSTLLMHLWAFISSPNITGLLLHL